MTIDFTCQKCEGTFELDAQDLVDGAEKLVCPHCQAKAPANLVDDFVSALTEMRAQVAALGKKFTLSMTVETEELENLDAKDEDLEAEEDDEEDDDLDEDDEDLEDEDASER